MSEKIKTILENAIREEEYFHLFYNMLAEKSSDEKLKLQLRKLAEQELMHKHAIESLSFEKIGSRILPDKVDSIEVEYELSLTPLEEFKDVNEMLRFAIRHETISEQAYQKLANAVDDEEAKALFMMFADEEKKHRLLLAGKIAMMNEGSKVEW